MDINKINKKIENYEVISFDIFDTLINRMVGQPKKIFILMEKELIKEYGSKYSGFFQNRIAAEARARQCNQQEEITLQMIYENLEYENKEKILELEKNFEIEFSEANTEIYKVYQQCIQLNKRIIICSDMYLDTETVKQILMKNGYNGYEKIYVSSDYRCSKSNGFLFEYVLKDLKIQSQNMLHIGDNWKSDYIQAKKHGIGTCHFSIKEKYNSELSYPNNIFYGNEINDIDQLNYWKNIGKYTLGNSLFGFCTWLNRHFLTNEYDHIFYLARDGYIVKKAMKCFGNKRLDEKSVYCYASRRSLIIPILYLYKGYQQQAKFMHWNKYFSVKEFIENFGLDYKKCLPSISKVVNNIEQEFCRSEMFENQELNAVYKILESKIIENSKKEYNELVNYLKQIEFKGKVAIVDSGWYGNLQNALEIVNKTAKLGADIEGYYIGIRAECPYLNRQKMKGFLFFDTENMKSQKIEARINALIEAFYSCEEGSTIKYKRATDSIQPVLKENESNKERTRILNEIQVSAINRVTQLKQIKVLDIQSFRPDVYFEGFVRLGTNPSLYDAWKVGKFVEKDALRNTSYYLFHPQKVVVDIHKNEWKLGQLKRILKVNIDYMKLYDRLDK